MEGENHVYNYHYSYFIKNVPVPQDGYVTAPKGPGLRVEFRTEPFERGRAIDETTAEL